MMKVFRFWPVQVRPWRWVTLGLLLWSVGLGWGLAQAQAPRSSGQGMTAVGTDVDWVDATYRPGQQLYHQHCGTCHVAIPPALFPAQTWQQVLATTEHYGVTITLPNPFDRQLMGRYLRAYSRLLYEDEPTPYRFPQSRFFRALHPQVEFGEPPRLTTCVTCHPGANQRQFRPLPPEWQD